MLPGIDAVWCALLPNGYAKPVFNSFHVMNKDLFTQSFLSELLKQADTSPRLRVNYDLRNSSADTSQRMLNALAVGTQVPVHRHEDTAETVICLCGKLEKIIYEEVKEFETELISGTTDVVRRRGFREVSRTLLSPAEGVFGMQVPAGAWHTVRVLEPAVIFEAKDGAYKG